MQPAALSLSNKLPRSPLLTFTLSGLAVGVDQRPIDQVFRNEPDLHLVRANHVAHQQVVGAVVALLVRVAGHCVSSSSAISCR